MVRSWSWHCWILVAFLIQPVALAETPHTDTSTNTGRPEATGALNAQVVNAAADLFSWPQTLIESQFKTRLPDALTGATSTSQTAEGGIADVVAELFGTINDEQLKKIISEAKEKKASAKDGEYQAFLSRVLWAAKILKGGKTGFEALDDVKPSGEKFEAFKKEFLARFDKIEKKNKEFYALLDKANGPDGEEKEKAKELLRTKYLGVPAFLKGQLASNNDDLVEKLTQALAFKDGDEQVLDLTGPDKVPHRVALGKDPAKFTQALRQSFEKYEPFKNGGVANFSVAPSRHENLQGNVFHPVFSQVSSTTASPQQSTQTTGHSGESHGTVRATANVEEGMAHFFQGKCNKCHEKGMTPEFFDGAGHLLDSSQKQKILETFDNPTTDTMAKIMPRLKDAMTRNQKDLLEAWRKGLTQLENQPQERQESKNNPPPAPTVRAPQTSQSAPPAKSELESAAFTIMKMRCVACHKGADSSGGPLFDAAGNPLPEKLAEIRETLRTGKSPDKDGVKGRAMPPKSRPQLSDQEAKKIREWIDATATK